MIRRTITLVLAAALTIAFATSAFAANKAIPAKQAELKAAVTTLNINVVGERVVFNKYGRQDLVLSATVPAKSLVISSSPQFGRVCLAPRPEGKAQPQPFGLALRKHLRGSRLTGISQPGFDRIIRLEFEECDGFGKESTGTLIAEIMVN